MNIEKTWEEALVKIKSTVSALSYELWVNSLSPIYFKNGTFFLSTTSATAKTTIKNILLTSIKNALKSVSEEIKDVDIVDVNEEEEFFKQQAIEEEKQQQTVQLYNFKKEYTFDNFVVGNSNKYVYAACRSVAENPCKSINPLFIYGGSGLGKTHLLNAIGNYITKNYPELKVQYVTCEKFTNDYIDSLKTGNSGDYKNKFREKYRSLDVLMIDDIQFIAKKTGTQEEFFHTFNELYENNKQIIIASDRPPREIATLEERLVSRFSMGLIQDIQFPDIETRTAILQKKVEEENYKVDNTVINYLAECYDVNIRELEGLLKKVHFFATLNNKIANVSDLNEALKDHSVSTKQVVTPDVIMDAVCKYYNINKLDLIGKKKNKEIVEPRQICMYIIFEVLGLPLVSIGQLFGGRDHTTVIHAKDKVSQLMQENNRIKVAVNDIKVMATQNRI